MAVMAATRWVFYSLRTRRIFITAAIRRLRLDMQLIPTWAKLDFAVLPIGDNFTMDVADAVRCADFIQCQTIVGVHYNTFGFIKIDKKKQKQQFEKASERSCFCRLSGNDRDLIF
jgi:L-ascorbate metabolism protein UlaG (beta-lactamase superfamily)